MKFSRQEYKILATVSGQNILQLINAKDKDLCFIYRNGAFRHFRNAAQAKEFIESGKK